MRADFTYAAEDGLILLHPQTPAAVAWTLENFTGGTLMIEPRYADTLIYNLAGAGLHVANGAHGLN